MTAFLLENTDATIRIYSRDELKQSQMRATLGDARVRYFLGDVRDLERLKMALHGVTHIFHAAALKHVDAGEYNPDEFVRTNIGGSQNVIYASIQTGTVQRVVFLSTDKCVEPINLYGSTKAVAEKLMIRANGLSPHGTEFCVVRYGNVTGSRGSVIPYWKNLLAEKKPLPLTDAHMTRFWISLDEAVEAAWFTMREAPRGVIVVPHLCAYKLTDLASALSSCDYPLDIVGIRPGEKLHESLMTREEITRSMFMSGYYCLTPVAPSWGVTSFPSHAQAVSTGSYAFATKYRSDVWKWRLDAERLRDLLTEKESL